MWRWRRVAVARVFALVVRCRVMRLLLYSRVGKNRDIRRESPAGAGAGGLVFARQRSRKAGPIGHQLVFVVLICRISAQKPAAPMTYTDLLPAGLITSSLHLTRILPGVKYISY